MQLVLFWVFAVLMLLFGAAVAYVRERQGRGGLWDASKDQRLYEYKSFIYKVQERFYLGI